MSGPKLLHCTGVFSIMLLMMGAAELASVECVAFTQGEEPCQQLLWQFMNSPEELFSIKYILLLHVCLYHGCIHIYTCVYMCTLGVYMKVEVRELVC